MSLPPSAPEIAPSTAQTPDAWFVEHVHPHEHALKVWLRASFPAIRDVEDIAQESYLRIWRARLSHPIASAKAFLFQVARHVAIDAVRERHIAAIDRACDWLELPTLEDRPDAADQLCYDEKIELLAAAFVDLPPRCREIMTLRKLQGMPNKDIAARLRITEGTVENQIVRGTKLCRAYLNARGVRGFNRE